MTLLARYQQITNDLVALVNRRASPGKQSRDILAPGKIRSRYLEAVKAAAAADLVGGALSEFSMRLHYGRFLINAENSWLGLIDENALVVESIHTKEPFHTLHPALHTSWHRLLYRDTDAGAVAYIHPVACLAFIQSGLSLQQHLPPDVSKAVGGIAICQPEEPDIQRLAPGHRILFLPGGVLSWGEDATRALSQVQSLAHFCEAAVLANLRRS